MRNSAKRVLFFVFFAFLGGAVNVNAQTLLVNYDFNNAVPGPVCAAAPTSTGTDVVSVFTVGGSGGTACTRPGGSAAASPPAFVANPVNDSISISGFREGESGYFQFQLTNVSAYFDYQLFFQLRNGNGPQRIDVQYSTDGINFTTFQTVATPPEGNFTDYLLDLSSVTAIENKPTVYFRIVGSNGTTRNGGTLRIDNFQVAADREINPSAASVTITGRVMTRSGRGIKNVVLRLVDEEGQTKTAVTSSFGYYRFVDVPAGRAYTISAFAKKYTFDQPIRYLSLLGDTEDVNFIADN